MKKIFETGNVYRISIMKCEKKKTMKTSLFVCMLNVDWSAKKHETRVLRFKLIHWEQESQAKRSNIVHASAAVILLGIKHTTLRSNWMSIKCDNSHVHTKCSSITATISQWYNIWRTEFICYFIFRKRKSQLNIK